MAQELLAPSFGNWLGFFTNAGFLQDDVFSYAAKFTEKQINLQQLSNLNMATLTKLKLTNIVHQLAILNLIKMMRDQNRLPKKDLYQETITGTSSLSSAARDQTIAKCDAPDDITSKLSKLSIGSAKSISCSEYRVISRNSSEPSSSAESTEQSDTDESSDESDSEDDDVDVFIDSEGITKSKWLVVARHMFLATFGYEPPYTTYYKFRRSYPVKQNNNYPPNCFVPAAAPNWNTAPSQTQVAASCDYGRQQNYQRVNNGYPQSVAPNWQTAPRRTQVAAPCDYSSRQTHQRFNNGYPHSSCRNSHPRCDRNSR